MLPNFFLMLITVVGGGMMAVWGVKEFRACDGIEAEPVPITIEELEAGIPDNPWRSVGEHYALDNVVYSEKNGFIKASYFPIASQATLLRAVADARTAARTDEVNDNQVMRAMKVRIIVKTDRWRTRDEVLREFNARDRRPERSGTVGLVVNRVTSLEDGEIERLRRSFPSFDPERTVIFEENREPLGLPLALFLMIGGSVVLLIGFGLSAQIIRSRGAARA